MSLPAPAQGRVLPTLNPDGTRRWLRPRLFAGRFFKRRRALAWVLIALFTAIPYLRMQGRPLILLDVIHREFTLFGATFLPTDSVLLMLLLVGLFLAVFLITATYGRVWCGWACPQTVYMEFLYRPIERLIEGPARAQEALDARPYHPRRVLKYAVFLGLSMFLAHTFLAYFVGVSALAHWVTRSPFEHPVAFLVMAGTTALMMLDFGVMREQICMVACPYGRLQSVLLDRRSLIVGYDSRRGEPRGHLPGGRLAVVAAPAQLGDCIDCGACVTCCPTGIDIRDGLQMECIHCTQCMDACDSIMDGIGRPRGLIRYSSRDELAGQPRRMLRPRVVIYPLLLAVVWGALAYALLHRAPADVTVLRGIGSPFTVTPSGMVMNQIRVKIVNRDSVDRQYQVDVVEPAGPAADALGLVAPENPLPVHAGKSATAPFFVTAPRAVFDDGRRDVRLRIGNGAGWSTEIPYRLLGPKDHDDHEHKDKDDREHRDDRKDHGR
ncbi:MAG TPA: cytochrome c oxidase accessory protein CcoG [Verrucomicrobiae bacterium]|jgi:cytochrome c oxidase accessory protein FixG|nr:cytochrome c oxidase accessory protein CcoG [Verrucomicrobiae bacterium]